MQAINLNKPYCAFKLKVGFGAARDDASLGAMREVIGPDLAFMVDANHQAWTLDQAMQAGRAMQHYGLA